MFGEGHATKWREEMANSGAWRGGKVQVHVVLPFSLREGED